MKQKRPSPGQFHCSVNGCVYYEGSQRFFSSKKLLDQHFFKVHSEKKFLCSKCKKGFGVEWLRKNHEHTCGQEWKCSCNAVYSTKMSLITHARRLQHTLPFKINSTARKPKEDTVTKIIIPVIMVVKDSNQLSQVFSGNTMTHSNPPLFAKSKYTPLDVKASVSVGVQTDSNCRCLFKGKKRAVNKKKCIMKDCKTQVDTVAISQTKPMVMPEEFSPWLGLNQLNSLNQKLVDKNAASTSSIGLDTRFNSRNELLAFNGEIDNNLISSFNIETQTDLTFEDLLLGDNENMIQQSVQTDVVESPLLANIQTQTNNLADIDTILSNMETQTMDDFLFSDLVTNIETQTSWNDISDNSIERGVLSTEMQTEPVSFLSELTDYVPNSLTIEDNPEQTCFTDMQTQTSTSQTSACTQTMHFTSDIFGV